jgi:VanZ family protein
LTPSQNHILKTWIAAILWLILIALESSSLGSAANTSRFLYPLLHFLIGLDPIRFLVWHVYIRKTGHFVGYFMLSLLLFRAWRATFAQRGARGWSTLWVGIALSMTALVASLDEWHQSYLPSRTGTIKDVFLDIFAALTAQLVIYLVLRHRQPISSGGIAENS